MTPSGVSVQETLDRAGTRRDDAEALLTLLGEVSGEEPVVWGTRIVGFGEVTYPLAGGRSGTAPLLAFAPGPSHQTLYLVADFGPRWPELLDALGPHRASKSCLHITRLATVDTGILRTLIERSMEATDPSGA